MLDIYNITPTVEAIKLFMNYDPQLEPTLEYFN